MRNTVQMRFAANNILLMRNCRHALVQKMADRFLELSVRECTHCIIQTLYYNFVKTPLHGN